MEAFRIKRIADAQHREAEPNGEKRIMTIAQHLPHLEGGGDDLLGQLVEIDFVDELFDLAIRAMAPAAKADPLLDDIPRRLGPGILSIDEPICASLEKTAAPVFFKRR
jgi:hypothetical protein